MELMVTHPILERENKFTKLDITYSLIISRTMNNIETPPSGILISMLQGIF
jgi:hypothetical protein